MKKVVISLFDFSGVMVQPWLRAGYECYIVDIQHPVSYDTNGVTTEGLLKKVHVDLLHPWLCPISKDRISFVSAFPPCDHMAVSGARWFKGKGLRRLATSIQMFATAAEFAEWSGAPYMIENPVSTISSYWRKPDYTFNPYEYTGYESSDNYTKKTCLWTGGGFVMPDNYQNAALGAPDNRIHMCSPGPERNRFRSKTPQGFAEAVFKFNNGE